MPEKIIEIHQTYDEKCLYSRKSKGKSNESSYFLRSLN